MTCLGVAEPEDSEMKAAGTELAKKIDELISYYEQFGRPGAGMRILVNASSRQLAQALDVALPQTPGNRVPTEFEYRGRVLVANGEV